MKKVCLFLFILIAFIPQPLKPGEKREEMPRQHAFGAELSFSQQLSLTQSPYGYPVGIGLFYQFTGSSRLPIVLGADVNVYGFPSLDEELYGSSLMVVPGFSIGYGFRFPLYEGTSIGIIPLLKVGQYFRIFQYNDTNNFGTRPSLAAGLDISLYTEKNIMFSLAVYYNILLDDTPINLISYRNRSGFVY